MTDSIRQLEHLVEAVEQARVNIAPTYQEYMPVAFAIANECGEAGREYFHRLCILSEKYLREDADKLYNHALKDGSGKNSLGTVWHLAEQAGVELKKLSVAPPPPSHTHGRAKNSVSAGGSLLPDETETAGAPPEGSSVPPPPPLPEHAWPGFLQRIVDCGESKAQRDILLLGAVCVLGATLNRLVCFNYGHKDHYPCLQVFVLAPPASGKGALSWVRRLADPIHDELLARYRQQLKDYRAEKTRWDLMGKGRANHPEPEAPRMNLFYIAGDNSGTGMQENLMDADGVGMICESEADTVSAAIASDYGHWSHALRQSFDHDRLAYNRRTNHEYRECPRLLLSVLLSGTPAQLAPLIPSPENGLFSRQLFYYMPAIREWVSQFDEAGTDYSQLFYSWGEEWKQLLDTVRAHASSFRLQLTPAQQERFDDRMARVFCHAGIAHGHHMRGTVARIAINLCRMVCTVAFLRSVGSLPADISTLPRGKAFVHALLQCPGITVSPTAPQENVSDGAVSSFLLSATDDDFDAVLSLVEPLYRHSAHVLMFLPDSDSTLRQVAPREVFLSSLPMEFGRKEAVELAVRNGISEANCDTLLKRLTHQGILTSGSRGCYEFVSKVAQSFPRPRVGVKEGGGVTER